MKFWQLIMNSNPGLTHAQIFSLAYTHTRKLEQSRDSKLFAGTLAVARRHDGSVHVSQTLLALEEFVRGKLGQRSNGTDGVRAWSLGLGGEVGG